VGYIIGAVASIAFFRCCSLYRRIYKPRRRRFDARRAICCSWHAVRCASLFAPLIYTLSRSPATPTIRRVSMHIKLHRRVRTLPTLAAVAMRHPHSIGAAHAGPTRHTRRQRSPPCGMHDFFPMWGTRSSRNLILLWFGAIFAERTLSICSSIDRHHLAMCPNPLCTSRFFCVYICLRPEMSTLPPPLQAPRSLAESPLKW
jgi:hypothetical protein